MSKGSVFIDESGCCGWKFNTKNSSTSFLTIAFVVCPKEKEYLLRRVIVDIYKKFSISAKFELKGSNIKDNQKFFFIRKVNSLVNKHSDIKIGAITVNKKKIFSTMVLKSPNILYNYMVKLSIVPHIKHYKEIDFCPDPRTIKVESKNSLVDYLQIHLTFEEWAKTILTHIHKNSHEHKQLQFIDLISSIVWQKYERDREDKDNFFNLISGSITNKTLFF